MKWFRARGASPDALFAKGAVAVEPEGAGFIGHFLDEQYARGAGPFEEGAQPPWAGEWLEQQRSALVTPRLFVTSSASRQPAPPGALALVLDPGLAFGDGHHATTRLCLRALQDELARRPGARVLDVGTGTGVLAIAARLLGASEAIGTDIDSISLLSARRNAIRNGVDIELQAALPPGRFHLVLANVPEEAHEVLAPLLAQRLEPASALLISGHAPDRRAPVEGFYLRRGLRRGGGQEESGWSLSRLVRQ